MGTNYYLRFVDSENGIPEEDYSQPEPAPDSAEAILRDIRFLIREESERKRLHIGKSSGGWCFSLHVIPEQKLNDLDDWKQLFASPVFEIIDEYNDIISTEEMISIITERKRGDGTQTFSDLFRPDIYKTSEEEFHRRNYSEVGPQGLLRHQLSSHCTKHGAGTWDCLPGNFS